MKKKLSDLPVLIETVPEQRPLIVAYALASSTNVIMQTLTTGLIEKRATANER